jgi:hypothetical protein
MLALKDNMGRVGEFDLSLPEILGVCLGQVDDASLEQRACSFAWTEYDDFHGKRFLPERRCISGIATIGTD